MHHTRDISKPKATGSHLQTCLAGCPLRRQLLPNLSLGPLIVSRQLAGQLQQSPASRQQQQ